MLNDFRHVSLFIVVIGQLLNGKLLLLELVASAHRAIVAMLRKVFTHGSWRISDSIKFELEDVSD